MWIFPKFKTNQTFNGIAKGLYGTFKGNVRRNWGVWPLWIVATNQKGYLATASTIVFDDKGDVDGRGLWVASTFSVPVTKTPENIFGGVSWQSCDFDDEGYAYFSGQYGTIKRDIMSSRQIWGVTNSYITTATDKVIRYNDGALYIGSDDFYKPLRKIDKDGNELWSALYNTSSALTSSTIYSIAFDDSNNVYVCGIRTTSPVGIVAKYDSSGNQIWSRYYSKGLYDIALYSNAMYIAIDDSLGSNPSIHIRLTDGTDSGLFGTNSNVTKGYGYANVEVDSRYIYASSLQMVDLYNRSNLALTASYVNNNLLEIVDIELYDGTLYFLDRGGFGGPATIYKLNATYSRVDESWALGYSSTHAMRLKKTY